MGAFLFSLLPVSILTDRTATVRPGVSFAVKIAFYKFVDNSGNVGSNVSSSSLEPRLSIEVAQGS
jgi:hypothetical protein